MLAILDELQRQGVLPYVIGRKVACPETEAINSA